MIALEIVFWISLAGIVWTHVGYPAFVEALSRLRRRGPEAPAAAELPKVAVIVAAYNEESVIERRVTNLLALDYPAGLLEVIVTSDASTDRTEELAAAAGARVVSNPRGGKVAAQDRAVRETDAEIVAFSDANATWAPDALRRLVARFADPRVGLRLRPATPRSGRRLEPRRPVLALRACGARRPSRSSDRSPAATGRSTPCAAPTTSRSTPGSGTTSRCPT